MAELITTPGSQTPGGFTPPDGEIYPFTLETEIVAGPPLAVMTISAPLPNNFVIHQICVRIFGGTAARPAAGHFRMRVGVGENPSIDDFDTHWEDLLGVELAGIGTGMEFVGTQCTVKWDMHRRFSGNSLRLGTVLALAMGDPGYMAYFTLMIGV